MQPPTAALYSIIIRAKKGVKHNFLFAMTNKRKRVKKKLKRMYTICHMWANSQKNIIYLSPCPAGLCARQEEEAIMCDQRAKNP